MGGGTVTLLLYGLCFLGVLSVSGIAAGLYLWGRRRERLARLARDRRVEGDLGPEA